MPGNKPIFFKPEDFRCRPYAEIAAHLLSDKDAAHLSNTKVAPLLQAMEIMREALSWYADKEKTVNDQRKWESTAIEAIKKCDEILKGKE